MDKNLEISYAQLGAFVVRGEDDKIDFKATCDKFAERLMEYEAAVEREEGAIAAAVHAVFDKLTVKGASLTIPVLINFALNNLGATPENYPILRDRIANWIRSNSDRPKQVEKGTGFVVAEAEPPRTREFHIGKGKNGGVRRWKDVPMEEDKPSE